MILSFHPLYEADSNLLCAGRDPGRDELTAIRSARAVILPQGCRESLYAMARDNCPHVFPDYDKRFAFPGKTGQARLFSQTAVPHPRTWTFPSVAAFTATPGDGYPPFSTAFPCVFKFDWGGEGDNVFLMRHDRDLKQMIAKALSYERTGQCGFLLQEFIPAQGRSLRVVVMHKTTIAYWRVHENRDGFYTNVKRGASLVAGDDPPLQAAAIRAVSAFCEKTGINLAGFDLLFSKTSLDKGMIEPLFLEINYFFGRRGLGGSQAYYHLLQEAIDNWLRAISQ